MKLSELFDQLTWGELSQLAIGNRKAGVIKVEDYPALLAYTNLGLTELYKRFPVQLEEIQLQQYENISTYFLRPPFAVSSATGASTRYILDTIEDPFKNNIIKIESIHDEFGGPYILNDEHEDDSVFTPGFDQIQFPVTADNKTFSVVYRAGHTPIVIEGADTPADIDVHIPPYLVYPLILFIASRAYSIMGSSENINEGAIYESKFERQCAKIIELGLINKDNTTSTKLDGSGWV